MSWLINPYRFGGGGPAGNHPYWEFLALANDYGADAVTGELIFAATPGGATLCVGGSGRTNVGSPGSLDNLFDGNAGTFYRGTLNAWNIDRTRLGYGWGAPVAPREMRWQSTTNSADNARHCPLGGVVLGSDDETNWHVYAIAPPALPTMSVGTVRSIVIPPAPIDLPNIRANARGWRIAVSAINGGWKQAINQLVFAATPGGATLCTGGGPISSYSRTDASVFNAFDGNPAGADAGGNTGYYPWRIGYVKATPFGAVSEVRITATSTFAPAAFTVDWSVDLWNWTTALSVTGQTGWGSAETRSFALP